MTRHEEDLSSLMKVSPEMDKNRSRPYAQSTYTTIEEDNLGQKDIKGDPDVNADLQTALKFYSVYKGYE